MCVDYFGDFGRRPVVLCSSRHMVRVHLIQVMFYGQKYIQQRVQLRLLSKDHNLSTFIMGPNTAWYQISITRFFLNCNSKFAKAKLMSLYVWGTTLSLSQYITKHFMCVSFPCMWRSWRSLLKIVLQLTNFTQIGLGNLNIKKLLDREKRQRKTMLSLIISRNRSMPCKRDPLSWLWFVNRVNCSLGCY